MPFIKQLPKSDFYAVIFSSTKSDALDGYAEMDETTMRLAVEQAGYLGYESVGNGNTSIFISYWENMEAIENWRHHVTHKLAKSKATQWYSRYLSQICLVKSSHLFEKLDKI